MANVTIPNLTSATTIAPSTDLMVLEQTNGTRKATLSQIFTSSATSGSGLGITSGGVYAIKSGLDSDISDINTLLGNTSIASIGDGTVTGAVSQINSDLTVSSDVIDINASGATGSGIVYKYGRICIITAEIHPTMTGIGLTLGQVLNKYYPINQTYLSVDYYSNGAQSEGFITTSGTIVFNVIEANIDLKVSGAWISAT